MHTDHIFIYIDLRRSSGKNHDWFHASPTAYPGFAVYHEGPDLVAVVSTGVEVWHLSVTGIIMNRTWVNIGNLRWVNITH